MIYKHTRHTAKEILETAGADINFVGKGRVRISGIPVRALDQLIKVGDLSSLDVLVGTKEYTVEVSESNADQSILTEDAQKAVETKGKKATERADFLADVKNCMVMIEKNPDAEYPFDEAVVAEAKKQVEHKEFRLAKEA